MRESLKAFFMTTTSTILILLVVPVKTKNQVYRLSRPLRQKLTIKIVNFCHLPFQGRSVATATLSNISQKYRTATVNTERRKPFSRLPWKGRWHFITLVMKWRRGLGAEIKFEMTKNNFGDMSLCKFQICSFIPWIKLFTDRTQKISTAIGMSIISECISIFKYMPSIAEKQVPFCNYVTQGRNILNWQNDFMRVYWNKIEKSGSSLKCVGKNR